MEIQEHILTNIALKLEKIKNEILKDNNNIALQDINILLDNIEKVHKDGRNNETTS